MTSTLCWQCDLRSHMSREGDPLGVVRDGQIQSIYGLYSCDNCHAGNLALRATAPWIRITPTEQTWKLWEYLEGPVAHLGPEAEWYPRRAEGREFPDVPPHIAGPASEAYSCHEVSADRAAIMLARAVVEATAKDKGITKGSLLEKINVLRDANHVRAHVAEMAHEIRHFGNDMAHGDFDADPTPGDASDVLDLMSEVLIEVYQSPARVAGIRSRREQREADRRAAAADPTPT